MEKITKEENNQDWHLQPKENTEIKPEKGIPRWLFYSVVIVIAAVLICKGIVGMTKPIEEKAYDVAMKAVESDLSGTRVFFEEYDGSYIKWLNDATIIVELPASYINQYGVEKTSLYSVSVNVENGSAYPKNVSRAVDDYQIE